MGGRETTVELWLAIMLSFRSILNLPDAKGSEYHGRCGRWQSEASVLGECSETAMVCDMAVNPLRRQNGQMLGKVLSLDSVEIGSLNTVKGREDAKFRGLLHTIHIEKGLVAA